MARVTSLFQLFDLRQIWRSELMKKEVLEVPYSRVRDSHVDYHVSLNLVGKRVTITWNKDNDLDTHWTCLT